MRISRETDRTDVDVGFVAVPRTKDDMAEQFGEEAVSAMTSGEDTFSDVLDETVVEEDGGPFVETTAAEEFATDGDARELPDDATREPFPKVTGGR